MNTSTQTQPQNNQISQPPPYQTGLPDELSQESANPQPRLPRRDANVVAFLSVLTLGLYKIYWLSATRKEMVMAYQLRIPSSAYLIIVRLYQYFCLGFILYSFIFVLPAGDKAATTIAPPTKECLISAGGVSGTDVGPSSECEASISNYYDNPAINKEEQFLKLSALFFATGLLCYLAYARWLNYYCGGTETVTQGKVSRAYGMFLLIFAPFGIGISFVQRAYNLSS